MSFSRLFLYVGRGEEVFEEEEMNVCPVMLSRILLDSQYPSAASAYS
jgi:predicted nucleic acid-binding Zn finger protein